MERHKPSNMFPTEICFWADFSVKSTKTSRRVCFKKFLWNCVWPNSTRNCSQSVSCECSGSDCGYVSSQFFFSGTVHTVVCSKNSYEQLLVLLKFLQWNYKVVIGGTAPWCLVEMYTDGGPIPWYYSKNTHSSQYYPRFLVLFLI